MAVSVEGDRRAARPAGRQSSRLWRATQPLALAGIDLLCMAFAAAQVGRGLPPVALAAVLVVVLNGLGRVYAPRVLPSGLDRGGWIAGSGFVAACVAFRESASFVTIALCAMLCTFLAVCGRSVLAFAVRRAHRYGRPAPTLVIGAGPHGHLLAQNLLAHPEYGLLPLGFLAETGGDHPGLPLLGLPVLGRPGEIAHLIQAYEVRAVILAGQCQQPVARTARALGCDVYLALDLSELIVDFVTLREHVRGFPLLRMRPAAQRSAFWPLKRALDIAVALAGLIVTAPVLAVCALVIRAEVGQSPLFRQRRVGCQGEPIDVIKLRTMKPADAHESATLWSIAHDSRVGPVGRLLRRTSVDELPQLWNVLKGDMSMVGPRPERPHFVDEFSRTIPGYGMRHRAPAGITGWAQIHGLRGDTSIEDRARFDNHYIDGWSLGTDIKIMVRTVGSLLRLGGS
ncbi:sugar transferase [Nonomuraea longispora]|uniref:Sugar transferase n=1 Tax=Nonomuraea longispora TaxID=1848320 RepID=A0A4R4NAK5_9ACTN|nr:sugar transferase [Nonomuraea longispora]TDC06041.1 sugar transferase [Nonomuraea longispora]